MWNKFFEDIFLAIIHNLRLFFDPAKEFIPRKLDKINLIKARKSPPVYWIYENNKIKRFYYNPLERKFKTLV